MDDNVADQRKGSKDTDQGDVCPTVEKEKTASPHRSDRKKNSQKDTDQGDVCPTVEKEKTSRPRNFDRKNPPETIIEKRKKVHGGVNDPSNEQEDWSDEKGQGGVGVVIGVSCDQDRTDDKIQESSNPDKNKKPNKSKKIVARQLPLIKHRHSSIYYHSAFTMYPRHKRPENISSHPDVLDSLQKLFSSRARVSTVSISNAIVESWNQGKKPSFLSLPPLTQESNLGDDGLTLQST